MGAVMLLVLFDLFDKSCSKYGSREGKNTDTNDNRNATHHFSQKCDWIYITVSNGCERDQCPPHCMGDAGIYVRLRFVFCVIHNGTYQYQGDEKEGQGNKEFFFFPHDDTPKCCYGIGIPPKLQNS